MDKRYYRVQKIKGKMYKSSMIDIIACNDQN